MSSATATNGTARATTRVLLVRHGESNATVSRLMAGERACTGLSALGRRQAERLRERLAAGHEGRIDTLWSSSLPRALETAGILVTGLPGVREVRGAAGWEELRPGEADGLRFDEIVARFGRPDEAQPDRRWWPGAETLNEFHDRVVAAFESLVAETAGTTSLVSCHGGVIDVVFRHVLGVPRAGRFDVWTLNTSITEFSSRHPVGATPSRWRLVRFNDAAHLAGLPVDSVARSVAPDSPALADPP
jgi:probable phosphoglycerate mutase